MMLKQTDIHLLPIINKIGCFVRSCGAMAELKLGKELNAPDINELWEWGKRNGHIKLDDTVRRSAPIATHALRLLGDETGRFVEVAIFTKGRTNYYASTTEAMKSSKDKWFIQKILTNGPEGTHFRNVDCNGEVIFEPYEFNVNPVGVCYSIVYVYMEK